MKLVFLLEEESMRNALEGVLPRILPREVEYHLIPHEGIGDLERSIPNKLRNWRGPDVRFVVVRDQERHPDCKVIKAKLVETCKVAGRPDTLVRIVCRALEAWYLADLRAVEQGFGATGLAAHQLREAYRSPDDTITPQEILKRVVPSYQKLTGARAIGPHLDLENTRSPSFRAFVDGVRRIAAAPPAQG